MIHIQNTIQKYKMKVNPDKWVGALIKPTETFKAEKVNADLVDAMINIGVGGVIGGIILWIGIFLFGEEIGKTLGLGVSKMPIEIVIFLPLSLVLYLLIISGIYFIFAKIFGGKGTYTMQTYLLSLLYAPVMAISVVILLIPPISSLLSILISFYVLYPLTIALKETHKYGIIRAVLTWMVPVLIVTALIVLILISFV